MSDHSEALTQHPVQVTADSSLEGLLRLVAKAGPYVALAVIYAWFGGMKFTDYEANAIKGLIANSPFLSLIYEFLSVHGASYFIGSVEIAVAALIALRIVSPKLSFIGALGSIGVFAVTFSFFFSTPGVVLGDLGFPAISVLPGQFLLKDLGLLVLSAVVANDSLTALRK